MNKFLASSLFLGLAALGQATTINLSCTNVGNQVNGSSGSQSSVCDTSALVGQTINSVTVAYQFTVQLTPLTSGVTTYSFDGPGGADDSGTVTNSGGSAVFSYNAPAGEFGLWNAGNSISIAEAFNGSGNTQSGSFAASITVDYSAPQTGQTPEPSTFIMLGSALTGLGVFARRRKA